MCSCALKELFFFDCWKRMIKMSSCPFCDIVAREKPARIVFEDEWCTAFEDIHPHAPVHLLLVPRKHISSLNEDLSTEKELLGHLLVVASKLAKENGIDAAGYRLVINTNAGAGQTIFHLHVHVLGWKIMR
jgi:histidine triad (HIT) family protein